MQPMPKDVAKKVAQWEKEVQEDFKKNGEQGKLVQQYRAFQEEIRKLAKKEVRR